MRNHIDPTSLLELTKLFLTMNKHSASKPILLVLYPYPMSEFLYHLYELNNFSPYCDVFVWDISMLTNFKFASALTYARATRSNIVSISTWRQFFRSVADLKRQSLTHTITIRTFPATNAAEFLIATHLHYSFRKSPVKRFDVMNPGLPLLTTSPANSSPHKIPSTGLIARFKVFIQHISSLQEARSKSKNCRHYFSHSRKNLLRSFDPPISSRSALPFRSPSQTKTGHYDTIRSQRRL